MKQAVAKLQEENQVSPIRYMSSSKKIKNWSIISSSANLTVITFQFTEVGDHGSR